MASKKKPSAPLTFDLGIGLLRKIEDYQKKAGVASKSEVIRNAIDTFDYEGYTPEVEPHRQISVRLPVKQKRDLTRIAKRKKVSLGELLRVALQALPEEPPAKAAAEPKAAAKAKPKKTASKAAPKKKTAAKAPAKKSSERRAAAKAAPARSATKRTTTSRAAGKKKTAGKSAARKASSPGVASRKPARRKTTKKG